MVSVLLVIFYIVVFHGFVLFFDRLEKAKGINKQRKTLGNSSFFLPTVYRYGIPTLPVRQLGPPPVAEREEGLEINSHCNSGGLAAHGIVGASAGSLRRGMRAFDS